MGNGQIQNHVCRRRAIAAGLASSAALIAAVGCIDYGPVQDGLRLARKPDARRIGEAMDSAALTLEEFGTMSVSSPLLAPASMNADDANTKFVLKADADKYFEDARADVQARAGRFEQSSRISRADLSAEIDVEAGLSGLASLRAFRADDAAFREKQSLLHGVAQGEYDAALGAAAKLPADQRRAAVATATTRYAATLTDATEPPKFPASSTPTATADATATATPTAATPTPPPADGGEAAARKSAAGAFAKATMTEFAGLLARPAGAETKLTNRAAINIAAGDVASESIFALLSDPSRIPFKDKRVLFGVSMVSVEPGWRSKENFAADVSLKVGYRYRPARAETLRALKKSLDAGGAEVDGELLALVDQALKPVADADFKGRLEAFLNRDWLRYRDPATRPITDASRALAGGGVRASDARNWASVLHARIGPSGGANSPFTEPARSDALPLPDPTVPPRLRLSTTPATPLVAAVSPMTDSETLDAAAGARDQRERAIALSVAVSAFGQKAAAKAFDDYAERIENDVATRGAANAVTAYSHSGSLFGFQVGPRLRADALARKRGAPLAAMTLERQSFPVLVIVGMDADDLGLRFASVDGVLTAFEPVLTFDQSFRWLPLTKAESGARSPFTAGVGDDDVESMRMLRAADLFAARRLLPPTFEALNDRIQRLGEARAFAADAFCEPYDASTTPSEALTRLPRLRAFRLLLDDLRSRSDDAFPSASPESRRAVRDAAGRLNDGSWGALMSCLRDRELAEQRSLAGKRANRQTAPSSAFAKRPDAVSAAGRLIDAAIDATYSTGVAAGLELPAFIRGRIDMLMYEAYGSSNEQAIPLDVLVPPGRAEEAATPPVLKPIGEMVSTSTTSIQLVIAGSHLTEKGAPAVSDVKLRPAAGPATAIAAKVTAVSAEALLATFDVTSVAALPPPRTFDVVAAVEKTEVALGRITFVDAPPDAPGVDVIRDAGGRPIGARVVGTGALDVEKMRRLQPWLDALTREPHAGGSFELDVRSPGIAVRSTGTNVPATQP